MENKPRALDVTAFSICISRMGRVRNAHVPSLGAESVSNQSQLTRFPDGAQSSVCSRCHLVVHRSLLRMHMTLATGRSQTMGSTSKQVGRLTVRLWAIIAEELPPSKLIANIAPC
jgi:hypothetical protein